MPFGPRGLNRVFSGVKTLNPPVITLTSDFGPGPFAGLMKGVILGICPQARLVDLSHFVPAQNVRAGAMVLEQALGVFGPGAIHLAVVDPGVGTNRRPICLAALGMFFVGPDNGLFTPALSADPGCKAYLLENKKYLRQTVSATFHGRDIFAPVAAHLALGLDPAELGPLAPDPVRLSWQAVREENKELVGLVVGADSFGNLGTNLGREQVEAFLRGRRARVSVGDITVTGISRTYGAREPGGILALYNSLNQLELAVSHGDLAKRLGLGPDDLYGLKVTVSISPES